MQWPPAMVITKASVKRTRVAATNARAVRRKTSKQPETPVELLGVWRTLGTSGMVEGSQNDLGRWSILINIIDDKIPYDGVWLFHFCSACVIQMIDNGWCFETWGIRSIWKAFVLGDLFAILFFLGTSKKKGTLDFQSARMGWKNPIIAQACQTDLWPYSISTMVRESSLTKHQAKIQLNSEKNLVV